MGPSQDAQCITLCGPDATKIGSDFNVFLIEVNTNPCLEESSNLLRILLPRMLDDLFKLTIDQMYQPTRDLVASIQPSVN